MPEKIDAFLALMKGISVRKVFYSLSLGHLLRYYKKIHHRLVLPCKLLKFH